MRNTAVIILLLFTGFVSFAQPKGFSTVSDTKSFKASLATANSRINDISSNFVQTKNLSLLAEKIKSKGKFYFRKEDKVRIEYTEPYSYLLIMNGSQLLVKDEQKTNKINTRNSKMMQSVNRIMVDCMRGTVYNNPDFKVTTYENKGSYLLSMVPVQADMKKLFEKVEVYMDKRTFDVDKLVLNETGGDFTIMEFSGTKHNTSLNEGLFKVR